MRMNWSGTKPALSVRDVRNTNPSEFRELYREQFGFVWRCLGALGVPSAGLDDAAQEVFVVVHRRLSEFRGESLLRTWLYGIVRNVASNARRAQRRRGIQHELRDSQPGIQPDPSASFETREAASLVQRFVDELDEDQRDLFVLALVEQLTIPEVAALLGIPLNTAYSRLRALRHEFRCALARYEAP